VTPTRWADVDLDAIRHNIEVVKRHLNPGVLLLAVVKADAYGHGAVEVSRAALSSGVDWLAVATVDEGLDLVDAGIKAPILHMGRTPPGDVEVALRAGLRLCVFERRGLQAIADACARTGLKARVHLKVETGMARLGVRRGGDTLMLAQLCEAAAGVELEGFWTHFAEADEPQSPRTDEQLALFRAEVERLRTAGIVPPLLHCANSAATLFHPETQVDMVRVGLLLYGYSPAPGEEPQLDLRPAMAWKAVVVAVHDLEAGEKVGYGGAFAAPRPTRTATVAIGYADGYPRTLSNKGVLLLGGKRVRVVGRVSMDYVSVDISGVEHVELGDEAVIIGSQGQEAITADELATSLDTISWEVLCDIGGRVPRVHLHG
jgi:alanine racemase